MSWTSRASAATLAKEKSKETVLLTGRATQRILQRAHDLLESKLEVDGQLPSLHKGDVRGVVA